MASIITNIMSKNSTDYEIKQDKCCNMCGTANILLGQESYFLPCNLCGRHSLCFICDYCDRCKTYKKYENDELIHMEYVFLHYQEHMDKVIKELDEQLRKNIEDGMYRTSKPIYFETLGLPNVEKRYVKSYTKTIQRRFNQHYDIYNKKTVSVTASGTVAVLNVE